MPLRITEFKKFLIKQTTGDLIHSYRPLPQQQIILRSRVDTVNNFYFRNWHFEIIPITWKKTTKSYKIKLRISKTFGDGNELEESIGSFLIQGYLKGKGKHLDFHGYATKTFYDKKTNPVATFSVGKPEKGKRPKVGRRDRLGPEKERFQY